MKEWSDPFNPFNSMKVLLWRQHLEACARENYLIPITVDIDPSNRCNYDCGHCFDGNEEITMYDFSTKPIKDVKVGDYVFGVGKNSKLVKNKVLRVFDNGHSWKMLKVTFSDGDSFLCTKKHKIRKITEKTKRNRWVKAGNLKIGDTVRKSFRFNRVGYDELEYSMGYIAGMSEGDGCVWLSTNRSGSKSWRFRLFVKNDKILEKFGRCCNNVGIKWHYGNFKSTSKHTFSNCRNYGGRAIYITTSSEAIKIKNLEERTRTSSSFKLGWISGIFDAEGSCHDVIRITNTNKRIIGKIINYCIHFGYEVIRENVHKPNIANKKDCYQVRLKGSVYDRINFFLDHNVATMHELNKTTSMRSLNNAIVTKLEEVTGNFSKFDIETETHNYLMKGVLVHNCNADRIIKNGGTDMSEEHLLSLADFLVAWGSDRPEGHPKSICYAGGGEPLMNKATPAFLEKATSNGLEIGVITNGSLMRGDVRSIMSKVCKWVGISMDAATHETYAKIKFRKPTNCKDLFGEVCNNIKELTSMVKSQGYGPDVSFKFLLTPENHNEIYEAAVLARSLGVRDFHLRPVGYQNIDKVGNKVIQYTNEELNTINLQIEEALKLENGYFRFFGIRHKFNPDFTVKKNFSRCWAIPILPTFSADGNVYMCFDMRGRKNTTMCKHEPDPWELARFWNSEEHRNMVKNYDISTCPRCTFQSYNEAIEKVIIKDEFCRNFP